MKGVKDSRIGFYSGIGLCIYGRVGSVYFFVTKFSSLLKVSPHWQLDDLT